VKVIHLIRAVLLPFLGSDSLENQNHVSSYQEVKAKSVSPLQCYICFASLNIGKSKEGKHRKGKEQSGWLTSKPCSEKESRRESEIRGCRQ